jgi:hypothetical protein
VQADICDGLDVTFGKKEDFIMMVWAGCEKVNVGFNDAEDSLSSGFTEMAKERANVRCFRFLPLGYILSLSTTTIHIRPQH